MLKPPSIVLVTLALASACKGGSEPGAAPAPAPAKPAPAPAKPPGHPEPTPPPMPPTPADARIVWGESHPLAGQKLTVSHLAAATGTVHVMDHKIVATFGPDPSVRAVKLGAASGPSTAEVDAWPALGEVPIAQAFPAPGAPKPATPPTFDPKLTLELEMHDGVKVTSPVPALAVPRLNAGMLGAQLAAGKGAASLPPRPPKPSLLFAWTKPIVIGPARRIAELDTVAVREESGFEPSAKQCPFDDVPGKLAALRRAKATIKVYDLRSAKLAHTLEVLAPDTCPKVATKDPTSGAWSAQQMPDDAQVLARLTELNKTR